MKQEMFSGLYVNNGFIQNLKEAPVENWFFTGGLRTITVKEEMKVKMLELLRAKVSD